MATTGFGPYRIRRTGRLTGRFLCAQDVRAAFRTSTIAEPVRPVVVREHAIDRMLEWSLGVDDVLAVLEDHETIEEYHDGRRLLLGRSGVRPLHVVVAGEAAGVTTVVTVYEPDLARWDSTFRRRRS